VAVGVGASPIEHSPGGKPLENRIAFTWYDDLSFEDILKHAAALPPHSAIFWELRSVDAAGASCTKVILRLQDFMPSPMHLFSLMTNLSSVTIDRRVGNVKNEGPECAEPLQPSLPGENVV
jgi:hypothetical protein